MLALRARRAGERSFGALCSQVVRVQPHVELREMKAEDLDHPLEPRDPALRDAPSAVRGEAPGNHGKIREQRIRPGVTVVPEPPPHERELAAVRLELVP